MSVASLVIGCISVAFFWVSYFNIVLLACGIIAIVLGAKGRVKSIEAYGRPSGLATAGLVLGIIGTVFAGIGVTALLACYGCASCVACGAMDALEDLM